MNWNKVLTLLLVLVLAVTMAACGDSGKSDGETPVAQVADEVITKQDVDDYYMMMLNSYYYYFFKSTYNIDLSDESEENASYLKGFRNAMTTEYVNLIILEHYFADRLDEILPADYEEDIQSSLDSWHKNIDYLAFPLREDFPDDIIVKYRMGKYYQEAIFAELAAERVGFEIECRAYYEENKEAFLANKRRASHIQVAEEEVAREVKKKLDQGADFAEMAAEYSEDDATAQSGGDIGWFSQGDTVEQFETTAYALEIGEISDPVKSGFGWHIIMLTDVQDYTPYEEALPQIQQSLLYSDYSDRMKEIQQDLDVQYFTEEE